MIDYNGYTVMPTQYNPTDDFNNRFAAIQNLSNSAASAYQDAAQRRMMLQQANDANSMAGAYEQGLAAKNRFNSMMDTTGSGLSKFESAIMNQESGGNWHAVNKDSGALGEYQVMPSNVGEWGKEAGYSNLTPQQFINDPQIQQQVAGRKLQQYYQQYGPAGAAVAWYAGPGAANNFVHTQQVSGSSQGAYPTVSGYMQQILRRMGY